MERPKKYAENHDLLDEVEYFIKIEKYMDYLENKNKQQINLYPEIIYKNKLPIDIKKAFHEGFEIYQAIFHYESGFINQDVFIKDIREIKNKFNNQNNKNNQKMEEPYWWVNYKEANPKNKEDYNPKVHCCSRFWKDFCNCV